MNFISQLGQLHADIDIHFLFHMFAQLHIFFSTFERDIKKTHNNEGNKLYNERIRSHARQRWSPFHLIYIELNMRLNRAAPLWWMTEDFSCENLKSQTINLYFFLPFACEWTQYARISQRERRPCHRELRLWLAGAERKPLWWRLRAFGDERCTRIECDCAAPPHFIAMEWLSFRPEMGSTSWRR